MFIAGSAFATVDAFTIPVQDGIYDDIDALYIMTGKALPSASRPWNWGEADEILSGIDLEELNDSEKAVWDSARKNLDEMQPRWTLDDRFSVGLNLIIAPEIYTHTNGEDFTMDTDWAYTYDERPVAANGTLDLGFRNWFYTYSEFSFAISRYQQKDMVMYDPALDYPSGIGAIVPPNQDGAAGSWDAWVPKSTHLWRNTFSTNIPALVDVYDIDFTFPKRALISFGDASWSLLFGRERMNWGHSHVGNFTIDDHVGYHEVLRLTMQGKKFKYDWTNLFLETLPKLDEDLPLGTDYKSERADGVPDTFKVMMNHRLEYSPWDFIRIAITESIMYRGKAFEVQDFNPAFIYHQLNNRTMFNSLASIEAYVTPYKGINLYFEFGLDNATLANEGNSQADASGWLLGLDYTIALGKGYLQASGEFATTSPIMYRRDYVDFLMLQRQYTLGADYGNSTPKLYYIGFPYGPDAQVFHLGAKYRMPGTFTVGLDFNYVIKGGVDMFESHNKDRNNNGKANLMGKTPTDGGSKNFELFLYGSYELPEWTRYVDMSVDATLAWVGKDGQILGRDTFDNAQDVQFSLGFTVKI